MDIKNVKDRIIEKSLELFYVQGVHKTGINQIIKESKVAKASFYQYFPSKDDLVLECCDHYNEYLLERYKGIIDNSSSFSELVTKWLDAVKDDIQNNIFNGCPIVNIRISLGEVTDKFKNRFQSIIDDWTTILQNFLDELKKNGKLPKDVDTQLLSRRILILYEGAVIMWKLTGRIEYFDDLKNIFSYD